MSPPATKRDIRFNNGIKVRTVKLNDKGHYDYGFWLDGKFTKQGEHVTISQAMLAVDMHGDPLPDRRPAWAK